ncbi:MAG TPA: YciI family protein [Burkholderiales bacterium]|nr:YciI family protein [Burkholderiales bacterium]
MLYMIYGEDLPNSLEKRTKVRPVHMERIQGLIEAGRLILAGPLPAVDSAEPGPAGMAGSLIVAEFDSLEEAREWIDGDPYVTQGVFAHVTVRPFKQIFPA